MNWKVLSVLLTVFVVVGCSVGAKKGERHAEAVPVRVMTVELRPGAETKSYVGTVEPAKSAYLKCRYPGKIVKIQVRKGEAVKAGAVLAEVESTNVKSSWEMAHSTLRQAEDGYERTVRLHEKGSISDVKMVEVETQLAKARASAEAADKALEDCKIRAPYDGVIEEIFVDEGVETDLTTNLLRIVDVAEVEIRFPVPENEVSGVEIGRRATIEVPALGVQEIDAKVVTKGVVASPLSHTYDCTLELAQRLEGLMPGMVTKVHLEEAGAAGVIVPASVVRTDAQGRYVWGVDDGIVTKKYVFPAGFSGRGVVIGEGLVEGDCVITEGVQKVCTGMRVRIVE